MECRKPGQGQNHWITCSDDITGHVTARAPLWRSKRTKITKGSVESRDGEIVTGLPNPADHREQPDTAKFPFRRSSRTSKPSVQFNQTRTKHKIKRVKILKEQSKPTATQEELDKCHAKVDSLEELLTHYYDGDHNNMESKQTNVGIFSLGVENNNSNGSSNCNCNGFWGILEVLAAIGITILVGFILLWLTAPSARWSRQRRSRGWWDG